MGSLGCSARAATASRPVLYAEAPQPEAAPAASVQNDASRGQPAKAETATDRDARQLGRTWGWTAVAFGSVAGVIALGTSYVMLHDKSTRDSDCDADKLCSQQGLNANAELAGMASWNAGAWILAAAGIGTGVYLLVTHPTDRATGTQVGIASTGSGAGVALKGGF